MTYLKKIEQLIPTLSIEEKVGQLFVLAFAGEDKDYALDLVKNFHVGGFYITDDNANSLSDAKELSTVLQAQAALRSCDAPLLLAVDQEGAWGILTKETDLGPGNLALGIANDFSLTQKMYQVFAQQMQAIGYNTLLSPCADVNSNPKNPIIGQRSFGEHSSLVANHVNAAVKGINATGNMACAKHFPGHGDTETDSHKTLPVVNKTLQHLLAEDLVPFKAAIKADVGIIMTAHINYPEIDKHYPATLSKVILTDLLKGKLGFKGLIITDSMNMWAMRKNYKPSEAAILAIKAGAHLIMLSEEHYENEATPYKEIQQQTINGVINAVKSGDINIKQIDETLKHVLSFKYQQLDLVKSSDDIPNNYGKILAQTLAKKSIKCLRNNNNLLPLKHKNPFYLTSLANPALYKKLVNSRGIGPNDAVPASQVFIEKLDTLNAQVTHLSYDNFTDVLNEKVDLEHIEKYPLVLLTEDYPLPGDSFDLEQQQERLTNALKLFSNNIIVLALRSDYELEKFPQLSTYVCSYSSRSVSAEALASALYTIS